MNRLPGRIRLVPLSLLLLLACGGDESGDVPGGPAAIPACAAGELELPDGGCRPAGLPPDMLCPPGDRALPGGACQPAGVPPERCAAVGFVPSDGGGCAAILPDAACPAGLLAVPGERACHEIAPCGEGAWGDIPVEATTQYVDQAYPGSDSDGSQEKPWKTVQAGVQAAAPGAIVAVAEGRYEANVRIAGKPIRLWGRCPAKVAVVGVRPGDAAITLDGDRASGSSVRGLAVTGPSVGVLVTRARSLIFDALWIHDASSAGLAMLDLAEAAVRGVLLEKNHELGAYVEGSDASIESTVVRSTRPLSATGSGYGIAVQPDRSTGEGGTLSLSASLVEDSYRIGVYVGGAEATIEGTAVRATRPTSAGTEGRGIAVQADGATGRGGKLSLSASLVEQNHEFGVSVEDSVATIEGTVVRATQPPDSASQFGAGIYVVGGRAALDGPHLSLSASLIEGNNKFGVFVSGSEARIEGVAVRATQPVDAEAFGAGIAVQVSAETGERGTLSLSGSLIEENNYIGMLVTASDATVESTVVRATEPNGAENGGIGIVVESHPELGGHGTLSLGASLIEQNHAAGVLIEGSEATVESTVVRATLPNVDGSFGRGITVQHSAKTGDGATLSLLTSLVDQNNDVGVFLIGSRATIASTVVRATAPAPSGRQVGDGILVMETPVAGGVAAGDVTITDTASTDNARAGVLYLGSTGLLSGVRSSGNRLGLVLQNGATGARPTFGEGNVIEGNAERNKVENSELPVPDAPLPLP